MNFTLENTETKNRCPILMKTGADPLIYHDCFSAVIYLLDATSIARVGRCCKYLNQMINDKHVVAWLSAPRALGLKGLSCVQHLRVFELVSEAENSLSMTGE